MTKLYYTPPEDNLFNELREKAIELWNTYDNTYGYASGKISRIKDIKNIESNFIYIVAMFDIKNQKKLAQELSEETCKAIRERMIDGEAETQYIVF